MRLEILNTGHGVGTKALFAFVRLVSGYRMPDAARVVFYRPDFYGSRMKALTHEAMRGVSPWSVGDRELMAAYVSHVNRSAFCVGAHTATASRAYRDPARVAAVLSDLESAPINEPFRATLRMLAKLARQHAVTADDMRQLLATGVTRQAIEDALAVCFVFSTTNRLADTFGFELPSSKAFEAGAKVLLARGYR